MQRSTRKVPGPGTFQKKAPSARFQVTSLRWRCRLCSCARHPNPSLGVASAQVASTRTQDVTAPLPESRNLKFLLASQPTSACARRTIEISPLPVSGRA